MTIATARDDSPWAAAVFYANDEFTFYFLSDPDSCHSKHIAINPVVGITVNEDYHDWRKIKGIQIEGKAAMISTEEETAKAVATYVAKYLFTAPYLKVMSSPFPGIVKQLDRLLSKLPFAPGLPTTFNVKFYKVTASRVRLIDNEKGFAHHEEFSL